MLLPHLVLAILAGVYLYILVLTRIPQMTYDVEQFFMHLFAICFSSSGLFPLRPLAIY